MEEVEELTIVSFDGEESGMKEEFKALIEKLPNVSRLIMKGHVKSTYMAHVSIAMKKIMHLDISNHKLNTTEWMNGSHSAVFENLQTLTVAAPVIHGTCNEPMSYGSTEKLWDFCLANRSLKRVIMRQKCGPWWQIKSIKGQIKFESLLSCYNDWTATRPPVICSLVINRDVDDPSKGQQKTREKVEVEVFGRALNDDEKGFFAEVSIDDRKY